MCKFDSFHIKHGCLEVCSVRTCRDTPLVICPPCRGTSRCVIGRDGEVERVEQSLPFIISRWNLICFLGKIQVNLASADQWECARYRSWSWLLLSQTERRMRLLCWMECERITFVVFFENINHCWKRRRRCPRWSRLCSCDSFLSMDSDWWNKWTIAFLFFLSRENVYLSLRSFSLVSDHWYRARERVVRHAHIYTEERGEKVPCNNIY